MFKEENNFHINSKDENTSTCENKTSWNREEVINLINKFEKDTFPLRYEGYPTEQEDIDIWIKNNL